MTIAEIVLMVVLIGIVANILFMGFIAFCSNGNAPDRFLTFVLLICLIPFAWMLCCVWSTAKDIISALRKTKKKREE